MARDKAREYKPSTIRRLDTLSGGFCAAPDCSTPLIAKDGHSIVSYICHIQAAGSNGPRYNPKMSDDERRHYNNLILLCDPCHTIIDNKENESVYSVELLTKWKKDHEENQLSKIYRNESLLVTAVNAISGISPSSEQIDEESTNSFSISEKIAYNEIKRNKPLIEYYKVYYSKINSLYDELEQSGSFKKEKLLRNIKHYYLKAMGEYVKDSSSPIQVIRENADNIFEDVEETLIESLNTNSDTENDDSIFAISIIMVDAFMRCNILEEPIYDSK